MCNLHYRNTYKNCKIVILYGVLSVIFFTIAMFLILMLSCFQNSVLCIVGIIVFIFLFVFFFFLLCLKNNDYKLKNYFRLKEFKRELNEYFAVLSPNKSQVKFITKVLKDNFLRYGTINSGVEEKGCEENRWNMWIEDQIAFNYGNARFSEKLSFLTYTLHNACASGSGLERFFQDVSYEPFDKNEILAVLFRDEFFSKKFEKFLTEIINKYNKKQADELYARYEQGENKEFFEFEDELFDCCVWLSYNAELLSPCVGVYVNASEKIITRMFLSKDYMTRYYIYEDENKNVKYTNEMWTNDGFDGEWVSGSSSGSIFKTEELALNDFNHLLNGYFELDI